MLPNPTGENDSKKPGDEVAPVSLVSWVMDRVQHAREQRDEKHAQRWDEYTRLWRGFYSSDDRNTDSERSRLIAPALQQAIEMTVSEIEEAVFGKGTWFDISDDVADQEKDDVIQIQESLAEDFEVMGVQDDLSKVFLLGAIYGTGIAKINVVKQKEFKLNAKLMTPETKTSYKVKVDYIRPDEFVIDPAATNVQDALFCAHEVIKPRHSILEKQKQGIYRSGYIGAYSGQRYGNPDGLGSTSSFQPDDDATLITEYYGKVPAGMLGGKGNGDENNLVEAIVVIANEDVLLRATLSPFIMKDRPIVAYQHDTVPGEFWGRGVAEKGYNPQKALDAELRARIDALALMTAPMMGADITRLPRNPELKVRPGRTVFTRGRPSEIYEPVAFGNPAQLGATFQQTGDLERMVQMGTGAIDSMTPVGVSRRNETAGGMSMMLAGALKRTKRTMQNLERQFLNPLIQKCVWRYIQFDPERYPKDYKFVVRSAMGIMAKEVENQQLVQMLGFVPPESPAHGIILKALFDNTASADKRELKAAIEALLAPPSPEQQQMQQQMQQLQMQTAAAQAAQLMAEVQKTQAEAELARAKTQLTLIQASLEDDKVEIQAAATAVGAEKVRQNQQKMAMDHHKNMMDHKIDVLNHAADVHATNTQKEVAAMKPAPKGDSE
jgi:hypothetical protein